MALEYGATAGNGSGSNGGASPFDKRSRKVAKPLWYLVTVLWLECNSFAARDPCVCCH